MNLYSGLDKLRKNGVKELEIYYAEDMKDTDNDWAVDVMQDDLNDMCEMSWTWTVESKMCHFKDLLDNAEYYGDGIPDVDDINDDIDWHILSDEKFSDEVIVRAIENWLKSHGCDFAVKMIELENAKGSGYVKDLMEMDLDNLVTEPLENFIHNMVEKDREIMVKLS